MMLSGCMYWDPINIKPKISQVDCTIMDAACPERVHRGDLVRLSVVVRDDGDINKLSFNWKAFRCSDDATAVCDDSAYDEQTTATADVEIPTDASGVRAVRIDLQLRDERGALAEQSPRYLINDPPTLELRASAHSFVVGGPVDLFARYGDPDEGPLGVAVQWDVVAPEPSAVPLVDLDVPPDFTDLAHSTVGKTIVPDR